MCIKNKQYGSFGHDKSKTQEIKAVLWGILTHHFLEYYTTYICDRICERGLIYLQIFNAVYLVPPLRNSQ